MLDLKYVCENIDFVTEKLSHRSGKSPIGEVAPLAEKRVELIKKVETLKATKNAVSKDIAQIKKEKGNADSKIAEMKELGEEIKKYDDELNEIVDRKSVV